MQSMLVLFTVLMLLIPFSALSDSWLIATPDGPTFGASSWFMRTTERIASIVTGWGYTASPRNQTTRDLGFISFESLPHQPCGIGLVFQDASQQPLAILLEYSKSRSTYENLYSMLLEADPEPEYIMNQTGDVLRFTVGEYFYVLIATGKDASTPLMYAQLGRTPFRLSIMKKTNKHDVDMIFDTLK